MAIAYHASIGTMCGDVAALSADGLKRVDLVLPPPARLDAGVAEGTLPRATQRALAKLLVACGLSGNFTGTYQENIPCASWPVRISLQLNGKKADVPMIHCY